VVTLDFTAASVRYVRVNISANTGWSRELSELEVYGAHDVDDESRRRAPRPRAATRRLPVGNIVDGNQATTGRAYNAFPQFAQVDLGAAGERHKWCSRSRPAGVP